LIIGRELRLKILNDIIEIVLDYRQLLEDIIEGKYHEFSRKTKVKTKV
jgi:hypothetical protein